MFRVNTGRRNHDYDTIEEAHQAMLDIYRIQQKEIQRLKGMRGESWKQGLGRSE
ncbi:hypothetical protein JCM10512_1636 [Bacteroides reticulotermitis JCM 10512]|uniref:Uncharacterized protein n=2 Tax=Bacteroides reticulotermitis TaxID=1133319 RepID=W4URV5_9BACE|nr:hypothetical protein JCM10512_1636 [Bacteroides reticulotermitis JCM 10512]